MNAQLRELLDRVTPEFGIENVKHATDCRQWLLTNGREVLAALAAPKEAGPSGLQFTDATIDKLQSVMAMHGFSVPVRVISDAFRTTQFALANPPGDQRQEGEVFAVGLSWLDSVLERMKGQLRSSDAAFDWKIVRDYHGELCRARNHLTNDPSIASPPPEAAEFADEGMALHWIDRYAAGIDDVPQLDRIAEALASPTGPQPAGGGVDGGSA